MELGGCVSNTSIRDSLPFVLAGACYRAEFRFTCTLNPGVYFLNAGVIGDVQGNETYLHRLVDIAMFRVLAEPDDLATGIVDFNCLPEIELQAPED